MSVKLSKPDDGTAEWARDEAVGLIAVAMVRMRKERGDKAAAELLAFHSSFCLRLIHETPALYRARYLEAWKTDNAPSPEAPGPS